MADTGTAGTDPSLRSAATPADAPEVARPNISEPPPLSRAAQPQSAPDRPNLAQPQVSPAPAGAPPVSETVYISFSAEINAITTESLLATTANLANQGVKRVYLLFSTPGGTVMNGMNLYNVLRAMPFELVTHNVGNVDSIGNAVFLAGKIRYTCPQATFMFHGVGFNPMPGQRVEEKYLREQLDGVLSDQSRIGAVIEQHTTLTSEQIADLFREQQTKDAAYAIACGIVHEVRDLKIPAGARIISLVFQR